MFDSRKPNPNCNFAEEIVAYIYDELPATERPVFESHLAGCKTCADEVASFTAISFSVREWREEEFARLATPKIEIPYETVSDSKVRVESSAHSKSWLAGLRDFFAVSNVFLKTAAAFGVIAMTVGLIWFFNAGGQSGVDVVEKTEENKSIQTPPQNEAEPKEQIIVREENKVPEDSVVEKTEPEIARQTPAPQKTSENTDAPVSPKKIPLRQKLVRKNSLVVKKTPKSGPAVDKKNPQPEQNTNEDTELREVPRLTYLGRVETDDVEDLRLSDLFSDIDSDR